MNGQEIVLLLLTDMQAKSKRVLEKMSHPLSETSMSVPSCGCSNQRKISLSLSLSPPLSLPLFCHPAHLPSFSLFFYT